MRTHEIDLPSPPTVNKYWTPRKGGGKMLTKAGRAYREKVWLAVIQKDKPSVITGLVTVLFELYMPDKRRRDVDNLPKGMLDGLTHAGIWTDDDLVDDMRIERVRDSGRNLVIEKGGRVHVTIQENDNG